MNKKKRENGHYGRYEMEDGARAKKKEKKIKRACTKKQGKEEWQEQRMEQGKKR